MLNMAETVVENRVCANCGVDVREGADFCYNCGKAVSPEAISQVSGEIEIHHSNGGATRPLTKQIASKDSAPEPGRKLQSAAAIRRRSKSYISKPVEIEWVEPERASATFVTATIVLTVLAILLLFAAFYLR